MNTRVPAVYTPIEFSYLERGSAPGAPLKCSRFTRVWTVSTVAAKSVSHGHR